MKKFIQVFVGLFVTTVMFAVGLSSCVERIKYKLPYDVETIDKEVADSIWFQKQLDNTLNPVFDTVDDVLGAQDVLVTQYEIDETFMSMPVDVLKSVATVCIHKKGCATKKDIVFEYLAGMSVYDNLIPTDSIDTQSVHQEQATGTEDLQSLAPKSTSYHYEFDTVNGKPSKVLVEERRYDSK